MGNTRVDLTNLGKQKPRKSALILVRESRYREIDNKLTSDTACRQYPISYLSPFGLSFFGI
jgi:hypothetical protein